MQAGVQAAGHPSRGGCCPAHGLCHGPGFQAETPPWLCSLGCKDKAEFPGFGKPWEQRHFPALPEMCCWRIWPLQSHPGLLEKEGSRGAALLSHLLLGSLGCSCSWLLPCLCTPTLAHSLQLLTCPKHLCSSGNSQFV